MLPVSRSVSSRTWATVFSAIPTIGAAGVIALTVAGQQAASLLIDRFGYTTGNVATAVLIATVLTTAGMLLGSTAGGWLSDRTGRRRPFVLAAGIVIALALLLLGAGAIAAALAARRAYGRAQAQLERLRVEFFDVAAVVHLLRKVVWWVPDFSVERYRPQLRALHERIEADGVFVAWSSRVLVEARRPA